MDIQEKLNTAFIADDRDCIAKELEISFAKELQSQVTTNMSR